MDLTISDKTKQILVENGLDFKIEKLPMNVSFDGESVGTPYYGLYNTRDKKFLNSVKASYEVSQTDEIVELVNRGLRNFEDVSIQKAGAINYGAKTYVQLAIEGDAHIGHDKIKRYVTVLDSNDGSSSLSIGIGDLTMSCQNQFFHFYKQGQCKFRHSSSLREKVFEIPSLIEFSLSRSMKMMDLYKELRETPIDVGLLDSISNAVLGRTMEDYEDVSGRAQNSLDDLYDNLKHEVNDKGMNLWGLHSGVTRWTTHTKQAPKRPNGRVESIMTGSSYKTNQKSLGFVAKELGTSLRELELA
jgi:hypothetical protein